MLPDRKKVISHSAIVEMVSESETVVSISPSTACSGCHAAGFCNVTGDTKKTITVTGSHSVKEGDNVMVYMEAGLGYNAVILGYVTPLFVTLITLFALTLSGVNELSAGLISIGILIPYFLLLYIFRKLLGRKFTFKLKKIIE